MDVIYQRSPATAGDVLEGLPDPPSYSAVRALLRVLETKGHVRHKQEGNRYIYLPIQARSRAAQSAVAQVVQTFFGGCVEQTVATLMAEAYAHLSEEVQSRMTELIDQAYEGCS